MKVRAEVNGHQYYAAYEGEPLAWLQGMAFPGARQRSSSLRSAGRPAASILAHCAGVRRMERCTRRCSGGTGGRPPGFLGCSMRAVYVMQKGVDVLMLL